MTRDRLARLRPLHRADGTVTAGNSCGINDGAAVVAIVDSATWQRLDRPGLRILAVATTGVDPRLPGRGLVPAVRLALRRAAARARRRRRDRVQRGLRGSDPGLLRRAGPRRASGVRRGWRARPRASVGRVGCGAGGAAVHPAGPPGSWPVRPRGGRRGWRTGCGDGGGSVPVIKLDGVSHVFGDGATRREVLRDIDLELREQRIGDHRRQRLGQVDVRPAAQRPGRAHARDGDRRRARHAARRRGGPPPGGVLLQRPGRADRHAHRARGRRPRPAAEPAVEAGDGRARAGGAVGRRPRRPRRPSRAPAVQRAEAAAGADLGPRDRARTSSCWTSRRRCWTCATPAT